MKGKYYKAKNTTGQIFFLSDNSFDDDYQDMKNRESVKRHPENYERATSIFD